MIYDDDDDDDDDDDGNDDRNHFHKMSRLHSRAQMLHQLGRLQIELFWFLVKR